MKVWGHKYDELCQRLVLLGLRGRGGVKRHRPGSRARNCTWSRLWVDETEGLWGRWGRRFKLYQLKPVPWECPQALT